MFSRKSVRVCAVTVGLSLMGSATSEAITIETVPVGNIGNTSDTTGYGAVNYAYNIGKYEVTAGQYTAFLNAVAATDAYNLYNTNMSSTTDGSGITRKNDPGSYAYSVDSAFTNRPVNYVSFWDATRFANWLNNGQLTSAQDNSSTENGAYTLTATGIADNTITRNVGAVWAVTSEDEWYKAAYHKNDGNTGNYFTNPTGSDNAPGQDMDDVLGNNANYYMDGGPYPIDSPYYTTVVGEFQKSGSPYGTFDQGGNVYERNETIFDGGSRGVRGGSFYDYDSDMLSGHYTSDITSNESDVVGFRVVQVPEPSALGLIGLAGLALLARRSRRYTA